MSEGMTWAEFVNQMRGPGVNMAVGFFLYWILDWYPDFELCAPRTKRLVVAGLSLVIPLAATVAAVLTLGLPANDWAGTWWPAIVSGGVAFGTSTIFHTRDLPKA